MGIAVQFKHIAQCALVCASVLVASASSGAQQQSFGAFLAALWSDAAKQGITRASFDAGLAGVAPDPRVIGAMQRQPEYGKPFGSYVADMVSANRIAIGQRKSAQWAQTLRVVEAKFGVPAPLIVSIWGIESSFGEAQEHWDVFRSLATLAFARFQHPLFRDELLSALTMLQSKGVARAQFLGSWAGAMGQAQFLPSSYLRYAVDFDGDGRADIWSSVPDVLASIANYLQKSGWQSGLPWGFEVIIPNGFDYRQSRGTFRQWSDRGVRRAAGGRLPDIGNAILFFPAGAPAPAFLVTDNFNVIKFFNNSDAYAMAAAELADRLSGLSPIHAPWPVHDFQPSRVERMALQKTLAARGYPVHDFTGHFDFDFRDDIRKVQLEYGMVPDGYPSPALLKQLGIAVP